MVSGSVLTENIPNSAAVKNGLSVAGIALKVWTLWLSFKIQATSLWLSNDPVFVWWPEKSLFKVHIVRYSNGQL